MGSFWFRRSIYIYIYGNVIISVTEGTFYVIFYFLNDQSGGLHRNSSEIGACAASGWHARGKIQIQETQIHVYKTRDEKINMTRIQDKTQRKTPQNARQEETRQGQDNNGKITQTRQGIEKTNKAKHGTTGQDRTKQDRTRQDKTRLDKTRTKKQRQDKTKKDTTQHDTPWHEMREKTR